MTSIDARSLHGLASGRELGDRELGDRELDSIKQCIFTVSWFAMTVNKMLVVWCVFSCVFPCGIYNFFDILCMISVLINIISAFPAPIVLYSIYAQRGA